MALADVDRPMMQEWPCSWESWPEANPDPANLSHKPASQLGSADRCHEETGKSCRLDDMPGGRFVGLAGEVQQFAVVRPRVLVLCANCLEDSL